jgi:pyridoxine 5-phosphate synthase
MIRLSVNVNKVATLRNSRGGQVPSVLDAVDVCLGAGVLGITVHPRADERHIRRSDVFALAERLAPLRESVELNIEGDPRPDLLEMVRVVRPHQCTLVPVRENEITSEAGWPPETPRDDLRRVIDSFREISVRTSVFVDPDPRAIDFAASVGADRVELYTEPYARAFEQGEAAAKASFDLYARAAIHAHEAGLGVNAGHDLDLHNLVLFRTLPHLDEVSIGHALISEALFSGLDAVVRAYLDVLRTEGTDAKGRPCNS